MESLNSDNKEDLFHVVTMTEEYSWNQGYNEGIEMGRKQALEEGFNMGLNKGTEIGREVGFYAGYATQVLHICNIDKTKLRIKKVCEGILKLAKLIAEIDPTSEQLTEHLSNIQGKFKQLTSLLEVQTEYITDDIKGSSF